jgi:hypothetical protein
MSTISADPLLVVETEKTENDVLFCPHFRCATCGRKVEDPEAVVVEPYGPGYRPTGDFAVVHKGACDRFDRSDLDHGWVPLEEFLCHLVFNSRVSAEQLRGLLAAVEKREHQDEDERQR